MTKTQIEQNKTSHLIPRQHPGIQAPPGGVAASNVGQLLEDGMDSSSEKNDVVGLDVSRRIPVVCLKAKPFTVSKSLFLSLVQSRLPDDVVHAVHQRRAPCKHRKEDQIIRSQTRRRGGRSDEPELGALEELFRAAIVSSRALPPSS